MSVIWEVHVAHDDGTETNNSFIKSKSHESMMDSLIKRGFRRIWKDDVPYQIGIMEPNEILWFVEDGVRLEAQAHLPTAWDVEKVPDAKEIVKRYKTKEAQCQK